MMIISWFFCPSPAVALIGAVLIPVAQKVGLPKLSAAMAMNLFGHGIALSRDIILQGASRLTSNSAGITISELNSTLIPLEIVMGLTTTIIAFIIIVRDFKKNPLSDTDIGGPTNKCKDIETPIIKLSCKKKKFYALLVFVGYLIDIIFSLTGGDATALVGGTTLLLLIIIFIGSFKFNTMEQITPYIVNGFQFAFKVFGAVIPFAAICYVSPFELARKNLLPVYIGLAVTTIFAIFFLV